MQSIFRPSVGIPAEESLLASSQALPDYGSEGWGFESLRARHMSAAQKGVATKRHPFLISDSIRFPSDENERT